MNRRLTISSACAAIIVIMCGIIISNSLPPRDFPSGLIVRIEDGMSLKSAAYALEKRGVIRSSRALQVYILITGGSTGVISGDYLFREPQSAPRIAYRLQKGEYGLTRYRITIPEGSHSAQIASILEKNIPKFDSTSFMKSARLYEGYLFPDTYFFFQNVSPEDVISTMRKNFDARIGSISPAINSFGRPLEQVISMASIVEREASSTIDRRIIAGILWKRLDMGMPLQVDAPFYYTLSKASSEITLDDLASDSPYNLYKRKGLPPTPISNPGLDSIIDTITPTPTKYLFYLADKTGKTHYATTFESHVANKLKYLRR